MTQQTKCCLICDDQAFANVDSIAGQSVPLCHLHLSDLCEHPEGTTADEVRKFFEDGMLGDDIEPVRYIQLQDEHSRQTDEKPGTYRTNEQ